MTTFLEEMGKSSPLVESAAGNWTLWVLGFLIGLTIELGTNTAGRWPCLAQPSDVAEAVYFSYWYIRKYIEDGFKTTNITYVAVYIARGWEAIMIGPCWEINTLDKITARQEENEANGGSASATQRAA